MVGFQRIVECKSGGRGLGEVKEGEQSRRQPVELLHAAHSFGLSSRLSPLQSAALGRQARPSVPFFDFGCWLGRRGVDEGGGECIRCSQSIIK
jgi:hypothetical protein